MWFDFCHKANNVYVEHHSVIKYLYVVHHQDPFKLLGGQEKSKCQISKILH